MAKLHEFPLVAYLNPSLLSVWLGLAHITNCFLCSWRVAYSNHTVHPFICLSVQLTYFVKLAFPQFLEKTMTWNFIQLHNIIGFIKYLIPVGFRVCRSKIKVTGLKYEYYLYTFKYFQPTLFKLHSMIVQYQEIIDTFGVSRSKVKVTVA